ncbi:MAG: hypothetical protein U5N53_12140 [Mycobacterium sp.]|nr:hypothetical protein [Mycobacterium sp.]
MSHNDIDAGVVEPSTPADDTAPVDMHTTVADAEVDTDDSEGGEDRGAASREAAKYRRQLRDAEAARDQAAAERDQLGERLAALHRRQAETLAREHLADGADMFRDGLELAALLDDDGNLDPAKVTAAAKAARKAHPHWAAPRPVKRFNRGGLVSGATGSDGLRVAPSWQGVLNTTRGGD